MPDCLRTYVTTNITSSVVRLLATALSRPESPTNSWTNIVLCKLVGTNIVLYKLVARKNKLAYLVALE